MNSTEKRQSRRREFIQAVELVRSESRRTGMSLRSISTLAGYEPNTLPTVVSPSMIYTQERFNYNVIVNVMDALDLPVSDILRNQQDPADSDP